MPSPVLKSSARQPNKEAELRRPLTQEGRRETLGRLFLFTVSVPFFVGVTVLLPAYHHLALAVSVAVATGFAAHELIRLLLGDSQSKIVSGVSIAASTAVPAVVWLQLAGVLGSEASVSYLAGASCVLLLISILLNKHPATRPVRERSSAAVLLLLYPGLLVSYVVKMAALEHSGQVLLAFFILVFGTDISGYLAGRLTGAPPSRLPVSPNKTIAGFTGALIMALSLGIAVTRIFPEALPFGYIAALALGGAVGIATILGDLVESGIKRAAGVKDSGNHMPGRGGVMDSIDSILLAAPVFYAIVA